MLTIKEIADFWNGIKLTAQNAIVNLREICPHEHVSETRERVSNLGIARK